MNRFVSLLLVFAFLLPSVPVHAEAQAPRAFNVEKDCAKGKCVDNLINVLKMKLAEARKERCLPPAGTKNEEEWFKSQTFTLDCARQQKELQELTDKLKTVHTYLTEQAEKVDCPTCKKNASSLGDVISNVRQIEKTANSCTADKKKEIVNKCGSDFACMGASLSLGFMGPLADKMMKQIGQKNCRPSQDSCFNQIALGFAKAVVRFFEGAFDLLKMAGSAAKRGIKNMWDWVRGAEDKSSTSQLAAAKASEDNGIFKQLLKDPVGSLASIWKGLMTSIKEWLKNDIFCEEWKGAAHFGKCVKPAQGFDCLSCKQVITGACGLTGTIVAEVVPAFLTGGVVTSLKFGGQVATKLRIGAKVSEAIKASKLSKYAVKTAEAVKATRVATAVATGVSATLSALNKFLLSPAMKGLKGSLAALGKAASTSKAYLMTTKAGPVLVFGTKAAKVAGKVALFPIDNFMTRRAYELGQASFARGIVKTGQILSPTTKLTGEAGAAMSNIDNAFREVEVAKLIGDKKALAVAEGKYLDAVKANRSKAIDEFVKVNKDTNLDKIIDEFYPELKYSKNLEIDPEEIVKAEQQLLQSISKVQDPYLKQKLSVAYQDHVSSVARKASTSSFTKEEVLTHANLTIEDKIEASENVLGRSLSNREKTALTRAIASTENVSSRGVFRYSSDDLNAQIKILTDNGFKRVEADKLVNAGLAGKAHPQDAFQKLRELPLPKSEGLIDEMLTQPEYQKLILSLSADLRLPMAKALKVFEEGGMSPAEAVSTYQKYAKQLMRFQNAGGAESDAAAILAMKIRQDKLARISDDVIQKQIDEAFAGICK